jgi:hypothetical protein
VKAKKKPRNLQGFFLLVGPTYFFFFAAFFFGAFFFAAI